MRTSKTRKVRETSMTPSLGTLRLHDTFVGCVRGDHVLSFCSRCLAISPAGEKAKFRLWYFECGRYMWGREMYYEAL